MVDFICLISTASPYLNFSFLFSNSQSRYYLQKFDNFLKTKKNTSSHEGQVNREAAISVIPNWPFEERPSVIRERAWFQKEKKKKNEATALAQRSKASNLFNAATIRARFIDVHAIDSELPLHSAMERRITHRAIKNYRDTAARGKQWDTERLCKSSCLYSKTHAISRTFEFQGRAFRVVIFVIVWNN